MSKLREKYKGVSKTALKSKIQEEDSQVGTGGRAGFLSIDTGTNRFRAYPPHKEGMNFYVMKAVHWITIKKDDGTEGRRTVVNSRIQAGLKKDIFEEYIKGAKSHLESNEPEGYEDKVAQLTAYQGGLGASFSWMMYADKIKKNGDKVEKEFGVLEFNKTVRDGLNKIACFEEEDEPVDSDPFTDPDSGIPFTITYDPKGKKATDKYSVSTGTKPKAMMLSEEELEEFDKAKPISEMFRSYSNEDLDLALQGLEFFDEEHEIGYFETDEFQETIESIRAMIKKGGKGKEEETKKPSKGVDFKSKIAKKAKVEEEEVEEESEEEEEEEEEVKPKKKKGDHLTDLDRDELKQYIAEKELSVKVFKGDEDEAIRVKIREAEAESEEEEIEEEEEEEEVKPKKKVTVEVKTSKKKAEPEEEEEVEEESEEEEEEDSLASIKAKIKSGKKK